MRATSGRRTAALALTVVLTVVLSACQASTKPVATTPDTTTPDTAAGSPDTTTGVPPSTSVGAPGGAGGATNGPLRAVRGERYLVDRDGRAVLLVGNHTWMSLQDYAPTRPIPPFDYDGFLDYVVDHGFNFFRMWAWEQAAGAPWTDELYFAPSPYRRTGPGNALDGRPRFDLDQFDDAYFQRLRQRVTDARDRGVYVAVMLFNGWSIDDKGNGDARNPCAGHPYLGANNVNGIDVDTDRDGRCEEAHTLSSSAVTRLQEAYVERVMEAVGDLDNVVFEISNESPANSESWQYHMIDVVRDLDTGRYEHPVGMSVEFPDGSNDDVFASSADWVAPKEDGGYMTDPPPADGRKVVVLDTDHLWGVGGDGPWVWRAVTRGYNVLYMDCYDNPEPQCNGLFDSPPRRSAIDAMGQAAHLAAQMDLREAEPLPGSCSSAHCLVDRTGPERAALVYAPGGGEVTVELDTRNRAVTYEWLQISSGRTSVVDAEPAARVVASPPFAGDVALLVLAR